MKKIRDFFKRYPILYALMGLIAVVIVIYILPIYVLSNFDFGYFKFGVREAIAGLFVLLVYWIIAGSRDFKITFTGFGYGFRLMRYLFILYGIVVVIGVIMMIKSFANPETASETLFSLLNVLLIALFVGIVEEFTFRAMLFGGLARVFGNTKKAVMIAAVISSFAFGFIHVAYDVFMGEVTDFFGTAMAVGKTVQAGLVGFVLAIIYYKTRNIWAVAALHSLNDLALFLLEVNGKSPSTDYVISSATENYNLIGIIMVVMYAVFALLTLPMIIRAVRAWKDEPEPCVCPMDDEFLPRRLKYLSSKKRKAAEKTEKAE